MPFHNYLKRFSLALISCLLVGCINLPKHEQVIEEEGFFARINAPSNTEKQKILVNAEKSAFVYLPRETSVEFVIQDEKGKHDVTINSNGTSLIYDYYLNGKLQQFDDDKMHWFEPYVSKLAERIDSNMVAFGGDVEKAVRVDALIKREMQERNIPGLQLAIVKNNKLVKLSSYGYSDVEESKLVNNNTFFPINSMTKAFTGTLIVQLASMEKLKLTDPIGMHLDNLPVHWQPLTIQQVLSHTSGLPSILTGNLLELVGNGSDTDAWDSVQALPLQFSAGSEFSYNQTGYVILGKIIEKYFAQSFSSVMRRMLADNGLQGTANQSFAKQNVDEATGLNFAKQYVYTNNTHQPLHLDFPPILWPAAGMASSAQELAHYVIALQSEAFFESSYLHSLWQPYLLNDGSTKGFNDYENGYAAGWQVIARDSFAAVSASGGNAVSLVTYPEEDLTIIVLTNLLGGLPIEFIDSIAYLSYLKKPEADEYRVVHDAKRLRDIPVKISFPVDTSVCSLKNKCPVAFLSSGYGVAYDKYSFISDSLNDAGYLVVAIQHELEGDPSLARTGNLFTQRSENWKRGAETLKFIRETLQSEFSSYDFNKLALVGHSNGGDISSWLASEEDGFIETLITLDHRRVPLPRSNPPLTLSIRGTDYSADVGVLYTEKEKSVFDACIVQVPDAKHNDMTDFGPDWLKASMATILSDFISGHCYGVDGQM